MHASCILWSLSKLTWTVLARPSLMQMNGGNTHQVMRQRFYMCYLFILFLVKCIKNLTTAQTSRERERNVTLDEKIKWRHETKNRLCPANIVALVKHGRRSMMRTSTPDRYTQVTCVISGVANNRRNNWRVSVFKQTCAFLPRQYNHPPRPLQQSHPNPSSIWRELMSHGFITTSHQTNGFSSAAMKLYCVH